MPDPASATQYRQELSVFKALNAALNVMQRLGVDLANHKVASTERADKQDERISKTEKRLDKQGQRIDTLDGKFYASIVSLKACLK